MLPIMPVQKITHNLVNYFKHTNSSLIYQFSRSFHHYTLNVKIGLCAAR